MGEKRLEVGMPGIDYCRLTIGYVVGLVKGKVVRRVGLIWAAAAILAGSAFGGGIIYVADDAGAGGDGASWGSAYNILQDALDDANSRAKPVEVWVAKGVYKPTREVGGSGDRYRTFQMINGVVMYGGFVGNEPETFDVNDRNLDADQTILSGDLNGDDIAVPAELLASGPEWWDNCYHVVTCINLDNSTILDGLVVEGGVAVSDKGGGIFCYEAAPTIRNCVIRNNYAPDGAGVYCYGPEKTTVFSRCRFEGNRASGFNSGGGGCRFIYVDVQLLDCEFITNYGDGAGIRSKANVFLKRCLFADNRGRFGTGVHNYDGNITASDCRFYRNYAKRGGAIFNDGAGTLNFTECRFVGNRGEYSQGPGSGGAIYDTGRGTRINGCVFQDNWADNDGGAIDCEGNEDGLYVWNSKFFGNCADAGAGGAILLETGSGRSAQVFNSVFAGNHAYEGGAICSVGVGLATIANCTVTMNSAQEQGGGVYSEGSNTTLRNGILWANADCDGITEDSQLRDQDPDIGHSCVQGWSGSRVGQGITSGDPMFAYAEGLENSDFRLLPGSSCIEAGDNNSILQDVFDLDEDGDVNEPTPFDLDGDERVTGPNGIALVDIGSFEGLKRVFIGGPRYLEILEGGMMTFEIALAHDPGGEVEVELTTSEDEDIELESGNVLLFDSSDFGEYKGVAVRAKEDSDNLNGSATITVSCAGYYEAYVTVREIDDEWIMYVDDSAVGANNGTSWENAYVELRTAIAAAEEMPNISEIRVAKGAYRPAGLLGPQEDAFSLINGVSLRGGYAGVEGQDPNERNMQIYETILSGDLRDNDTDNFVNREDNSWHVLKIDGCDNTAILEGFTISGGYAYDMDSDRRGAGIYIESSGAILRNCRVVNNYAHNYGGGAYICQLSTALLQNCTLSGNYAARGGAVYNSYSSPEIVGCVFTGNSGRAAIENHQSWCVFRNCIVANNEGAGFINEDEGLPMLFNCTIYGNKSVDSRAGALYFDRTSGSLSNCIVWDNDAEVSEQISVTSPGFVQVEYSCVQGSEPGAGYSYYRVVWGQGNIDTPPLFVDASASDYHLKSEGWRWDVGRGVWTWDDVTSRCIDAGCPAAPLGDEPLTLDVDPENEFGVNKRINMGAYGGTSEASMGPEGWSLLGDLSNDGIVNGCDYSAMVMEENGLGVNCGDINRDGAVDMYDIAELAGQWLEETNWH